MGQRPLIKERRYFLFSVDMQVIGFALTACQVEKPLSDKLGKALRSCFCIENFSSLEVERHSKPEIEMQYALIEI